MSPKNVDLTLIHSKHFKDVFLKLHSSSQIFIHMIIIVVYILISYGLIWINIEKEIENISSKILKKLYQSYDNTLYKCYDHNPKGISKCINQIL